MRRAAGLTAPLAVLAPVVGTVVAAPLSFPNISGFWQGLVVQSFLLLAPLDMPVHRRRPAWIGLRRAGLRRALVPAAVLSAGYLLLLFIGARVGITIPHFDGARRELGLVPVLALYVPFWGVLEAVWVNHLVRTVTGWFGHSRPTAAAILLAGAWFGVVHVIATAALEGGGVGSLISLYVGVFAIFAGVLLRRSGNGWGFVLFWTIVNF